MAGSCIYTSALDTSNSSSQPTPWYFCYPLNLLGHDFSFPQFLFISIFSYTTVNSCFFIFLSCLLFLCPIFWEIYARMVIIIKPWRLLLLWYWVKSREKYISPDSLGMGEAAQPWSFDNLVIRIFVFAPDLWLLQIYDCALGRLAAFSAEGSRSDLRLAMWPWKWESWLGGLKRWGGG